MVEELLGGELLGGELVGGELVVGGLAAAAGAGAGSERWLSQHRVGRQHFGSWSQH